MAKFKKLALLCTALMMTASAAAIASCGESDRPDSSSQQQSSASSSVEESSEDVVSSEAESSEDAVSSEVESSEDVGSSEEPEVSEDPASSEEPEVSEDSSSEEPEDSSSEEPPVEEHFYYTNIVDGAAASLVLTGNYAETFGTIKFNAPSAGTYAIYAVTDLESFNESEVKFGPAGATDGWNECFTRYTFTVDAAGEVTLSTYGSSWEAKTLNFNYFVYQLEACGEKGSSVTIENLAANVRNEVSVEIPAAGDYLIIAYKTVDWYGSLTQSWPDYEGYSYQVTAEEAGKLTVYVEYVDYNSEDFDFSYEIVSLALPELVVGENTVALYSGVNQTAYFTAETAGAYTFTISSDWNVNFTDNYETTLVVSADAGEKVAIGLRYSGYNVDYSQEGPLVIGVNVTVEAFVEDDPSALQLGDNTFTASAEGTVITFTATEAGKYIISEGNGELYETGDEWGSYNKEVVLEAGQSVSYTVKYDGVVTVTVALAPLTLDVGETTLNVAGEGCDIYVADPVADGTYILAWNNENVLVYINGAPFVSGSEFDYVWYNYNIYAETADGANAAGVVFTLTAVGGSTPDNPVIPETPKFVLGENAVAVENTWQGVIMSYTSAEGGNFVLKAADGETNGWLDTMTFNANFDEYVRDNNAICEAAFTSYAFTLEAGETITFWVSTWDENADTINLILETAGTQPEEPEVVTVQFSAGMPTYVEIPANGQTIMEGYIVGKYKVEWDPSVTNLVVYYGMQPVANGDIIEVPSPRVPTQLTLSTSDGAFLATRVMVSEYVAPAIQAVLGENAIDVVDPYAGTQVTFTAPKAATYILKAANGEENAIVLVEGMYGADMLTLPYEVELAEGEVFAFIVVTANYEADTINLVIEEKITVQEYQLGALELHVNSTVGPAKEQNDALYLQKIGGENLPVMDWEIAFTYVSGTGFMVNDAAATLYELKSTADGLFLKFDALNAGDTVMIGGTYKCDKHAAIYVIEESKFVWNGSIWEKYIEYTTYEVGKVAIATGSGASAVYFAPANGEKLEIVDGSWAEKLTFVADSGIGITLNGAQLAMDDIKIPNDIYVGLGATAVEGDVLAIGGTFYNANLAVKYVIEESKFQWNGSAWENYVEYTTYELGKVFATNDSNATAAFFWPTSDEGFAVVDGTWTEKLTFLADSGIGITINGTQIDMGDIKIPGTMYVGLGTTAVAGDVLAIGGTFYNANLAVKYVIEESKLEFNGEAWVAYIPYYTVKEANAAADDTQVRIANATVCAVNGAWNTDYNNMNVTVTDASGETLYVYRLATEVALGDIITLTGTMATYNEARQIAQGATAVITGHDSSYDYEEMTILQALAAADDTNVIVTGTVVTIDTAWSTQYKNMSVTISDGESNTLYLYRLATQVGLGDVITVKGCMATYNGARQIAAGATAEIIEEHTCSEYTEATCKDYAKCVVCGEAKDDVLGNHNYVNGTCSVCGAQEGVSTVTASKTIAELITSEGWTNTTTKQQFKLDDVVTVKVNGGSNTGKAYDGDHIRIYATDNPAGTLTISVADGYELVSIKVTTKTGTYAFLYVDGTTTDICNQSVAVSGSSVKLNSVKNGSNGKQVRVTAIEVVYAVPAPEAPAEPEADPVTINLDVANNLTIGEGTYLTGSVVLNGEYTFAWTNSDNATVTIKVDGVAIDNGYKANYENKTVEIIIESSDNTVDVNVSLTVTKTPEVVVPDEEWTKNY